MPVNKKSVTNIAGYKFEPIKNAVDLISVYQEKCKELGLKGTMLISKNGINFHLLELSKLQRKLLLFLKKTVDF